MTSEPERKDGMGEEDLEIDPYLWDGSGEPDLALARLEKALEPAKWKRSTAGGSVPEEDPRKLGIGWRSGLALAAGLGLIAAGIWAVIPGARDTGWSVETLAGVPGLGDGSVEKASALRAGAWVRTDSVSRARLRGAGVGQVDVEPNSRVRLLKATKDEHRLELDRGSISAFVTTPPRVFFVNTPAATAVDMGCAYKLNVDEAGEGVLYVTLGWVELHADGGAAGQAGGREVRVPAGAACRIGANGGPNPGPGTPWFEDAEKGFAAAVGLVDSGHGGLDELISGARVRDSLTLWHLVGSLDGPDRARVAARLAELVPPPEGVTLSALDASGMDRWWGAVRASW